MAVETRARRDDDARSGGAIRSATAQKRLRSGPATSGPEEPEPDRAISAPSVSLAVLEDRGFEANQDRVPGSISRYRHSFLEMSFDI